MSVLIFREKSVLSGKFFRLVHAMAQKRQILSISVNTFIRYYCLDMSKLITEISRRMQGVSGYNYYGMLNDSVRARANGASSDEIKFILNRSPNVSENFNNGSAFKKFEEKFGNKKNISAFDRSGKVKLCSGQLVVSVSPQFSIESSRGFSVYNIWALQTPDLDRGRAAIGVYLMQQAFIRTLPNYTYRMFSAKDGKTYSTIGNTTPQAVNEFSETIVRLALSAKGA